MIAVDTSVVVPGVLSHHPAHARAVRVLAGKPVLPAHAAVEAFAVLTRLPSPLRLAPMAAATVLERNFDGRLIDLGRRSMVAVVRELAERGVTGGAVFDALIAETARRSGAKLATFDERAAGTYAAVGVDVQLLRA